MVIGRDVIPVHMINTYTQFPASGGGGYTAEVYINPASGVANPSGNIFVQAGIPVQDGSGGIEFIDGNTNDGVGTLSTASSPTRTTQIMEVSTADLLSAYNTVNTGSVNILIAGFINHNGDSASSFLWSMPSSIIVSSSMSNSTAVAFETCEDRQAIQNNGSFHTSSTQGLYHCFGTGDSGSGFYHARIDYGGGRGGITFPSNGDTFTVRITASATVTKDGTDHASTSAIHDLIVNITS